MDASKTQLLEAFRQYLDSADLPVVETAAQTDLYSLFSELAALRTEVKTESRQFAATLEQTKETQELLRTAQTSLERQSESLRGEIANLRRSTLRPLLLELLDLYDRFSSGSEALQKYRPVLGWFRTIKSRKEDRNFIQSVQQGQAMTLRRLEEALARQGVRPLETVGRPVDPHTMTVVELDRDPELDNGIVTAELRKGFLWGEEVLRLSEVKANKL